MRLAACFWDVQRCEDNLFCLWVDWQWENIYDDGDKWWISSRFVPTCCLRHHPTSKHVHRPWALSFILRDILREAFRSAEQQASNTLSRRWQAVGEYCELDRGIVLRCRVYHGNSVVRHEFKSKRINWSKCRKFTITCNHANGTQT